MKKEQAENVVGFYNENKKVMLINIPKNASTSLRTCLTLNKVGKLSAISNFEEYTIISVLRNPVDRIVSQYVEVILRKTAATQELPFYKMREGSKEKFVEFLKEIGRGTFDVHVSKQSDVLCDEEGSLLDIDYLLLFETFKADVDIMREELGLKFDLPHSKKGNKKEIYTKLIGEDSEVKNLVIETYKKDWEIYNKIKNERK